MHIRWLVTLAGLAAVLTLQSTAAQVRTTDPERLLAERFGFTAAEVAQARTGKAVAKLLPRQDSKDVGVLAAVRIDAKADRLAYWFKDIASFRRAAELGISGRISASPQVTDFAGLSLDQDELVALRDCRPGACDLRLGDRAIRRFQTEVDWAGADAGRRANLLMRELLLGHATAYLKGGDQALGAYHNDTAPRVLAEEFRLLLAQSRKLYDVAAPLADYLERFPSISLQGAEQFLYWGKGGVGSEASITLHQMVIYHAPGGETFIADKQLYASRYVDAGLVVVSLVPAPNAAGFYALVGARARSTMLDGVAARLLRGRVEKVTLDTAAMYLNWIRASLMAGS